MTLFVFRAGMLRGPGPPQAAGGQAEHQLRPLPAPRLLEDKTHRPHHKGGHPHHVAPVFGLRGVYNAYIIIICIYVKKWLYPQKIYSKEIEGRKLKLVSSLSAFVYWNIVRGWIQVLIPSLLFPCYKLFVDIITFLSYYFTELVKIYLFYVYMYHQ